MSDTKHNLGTEPVRTTEAGVPLGDVMLPRRTRQSSLPPRERDAVRRALAEVEQLVERMEAHGTDAGEVRSQAVAVIRDYRKRGVFPAAQ